MTASKVEGIKFGPLIGLGNEKGAKFTLTCYDY